VVVKPEEYLMKALIDGLARFQRDVYPQHQRLFQRLASGQNPEALILTCSDSRIVISLITQTNPGDLFICRNAGNIAPAHTEASGGVSATIEYAVAVLKVRDIIVCGHTDCGAMKALLHPQRLSGLPAISAWLRHAERARAVVIEKYGRLEEHELLDKLVEENVVTQLTNLRTHPCVAAREETGELSLHGWVYDIQTGRVRAYDPNLKTFLEVVGTSTARHLEQVNA
jgi:carbonic anhydrase